MTRFSDCDFCEDFPSPRLAPDSPLVDLERLMTDLLEQARVTQSIIVMLPGPLRGYELLEIPLSSARADLVLTAIGKKP